MKSKIEMVNDYVCAEINRVGLSSMSDERIMEAWRIADKMQAEVDKRNQDSQSLTKDQEGNCLHFHHEFGHKKCMDCGASLDDTQSQLDKIIHDDELMLREQARIKGINLDDYSFVKPYTPK